MTQIPQGEGQSGGKISKPEVDLAQLAAYVNCLKGLHESLRLVTESACKLFLDADTYMNLLAEDHFNDMALIELRRVRSRYQIRENQLQRLDKIKADLLCTATYDPCFLDGGEICG
jgi:hypothetical protein